MGGCAACSEWLDLMVKLVDNFIYEDFKCFASALCTPGGLPHRAAAGVRRGVQFGGGDGARGGGDGAGGAAPSVLCLGTRALSGAGLAAGVQRDLRGGAGLSQGAGSAGKARAAGEGGADRALCADGARFFRPPYFEFARGAGVDVYARRALALRFVDFAGGAGGAARSHGEGGGAAGEGWAVRALVLSRGEGGGAAGGDGGAALGGDGGFFGAGRRSGRVSGFRAWDR